MVSFGSFSLGSWCHLVGTGGGTDIDVGKGLANRLTREGFSRHTADATELLLACLALGSSPSETLLPDALRFSLDRLLRSRGSCGCCCCCCCCCTGCCC